MREEFAALTKEMIHASSHQRLHKSASPGMPGPTNVPQLAVLMTRYSL